MEWIYIAILAPIFFAIGNLWDKYLLEKHMKGAGAYIILSASVSILTVIGIIIFYGIEKLPLFQMGFLFLSGILIVTAYLLYAKALELEDTSLVIPLFQLIPVFLLILGFIFLGESLSQNQLLAFIIIFAGSLVLGTDNFSSFKIKKAFWYMLVSSFLLAASPVIFKYISLEFGFLTTITYELLGYSIGAMGLMIFPAYRKEVFRTINSIEKKVYVYLGLTDAFDLIGQVLWKYALTLGPVALVSVVMVGIQPFFILLLAFLFTLFLPHIIKEDFSESVVVRKLIGMVVMGIGVYVLFIL